MWFVGNILIMVLDVYSWIIIASAITSWLIAFEVINIRTQQAQNLVGLLDRLTEPAYRPIRKYVPPIGGIDITPLVVIFGIYFLKLMIVQVFY